MKYWYNGIVHGFCSKNLYFHTLAAVKAIQLFKIRNCWLSGKRMTLRPVLSSSEKVGIEEDRVTSFFACNNINIIIYIAFLYITQDRKHT